LVSIFTNETYVSSLSLWYRSKKAGDVLRMGVKRNAYRILVGNPEGTRPLGRPRHRLEDNIKLDLGEIVLG
jgi:hypothetical protein